MSSFFAFPAFAANVPALKGRVNDYAKIIRDNDEHEIEEYLAGIEEASGIQIAVLTMPSLDGEDISSFGIRVADKWQLGDKEKDKKHKKDNKSKSRKEKHKEKNKDSSEDKEKEK